MRNTGSPVVIEIEENRFEIFPSADFDIASLASDHKAVYTMVREGTSYEIRIIDFDAALGICNLWVNGQMKQARIIRDIELTIEAMGLNAAHSKKHDVIVAPMPGLVSDIKITTGQHVTKGTPLLILEAMKMENVISAPHDAIIKEIKVIKGQTVERGLILIEFVP